MYLVSAYQDAKKGWRDVSCCRYRRSRAAPKTAARRWDVRPGAAPAPLSPPPPQPPPPPQRAPRRPSRRGRQRPRSDPERYNQSARQNQTRRVFGTDCAHRMQRSTFETHVTHTLDRNKRTSSTNKQELKGEETKKSRGACDSYKKKANTVIVQRK